MYDADEGRAEAEGWCPQVIDTNGDGKITRPWNAADNRKPDPKLDTEVRKPHVLAWSRSRPMATSSGALPKAPMAGRGYIVRLDRGNNPPQTCIAEVYRVPRAR